MKYRIFFICLMILGMSSCNWFSDSKAIKIVIIGLKTKNENNISLIRGAELAVNELNAKGGLLGRNIKLVPIQTKDDVNEGMVIAESLSKESNLLAVIGHVSSDVTLPVSSIYERSKVIMITPTATSDLITEHKHDYIFRMVPNNQMIGARMAEYFVSKGLKNVLIFYPRTEYGLNLANDFEKTANQLGLNIVDRRSYYEQSGNYNDLLTYWKQHYDFDSLLLIGSMPEGAYILNQIREAGLDVPIVSGDAMSAQQLITMSGKNAEGLVAVAFADLEYSKNQGLKTFRNDYLKKYQAEPDQFSLLGYDSIMLLANAVSANKSLSNTDVANYLHQTAYHGLVTGYEFDENGDNKLFGKPFLFKVQNGVFTLIK